MTPTEGAVVRTFGLTHLSLVVKDLERSLRFYRRVFGAKVYWREPGSAQVKTPGCHDVIAFEEKKRGAAGKTGGIQHFGFRLVDPKDIDKVVKDAVAAGGRLLRRGEFSPGFPYAYVSDPTATRSRSGTSDVAFACSGPAHAPASAKPDSTARLVPRCARAPAA